MKTVFSDSGRPAYLDRTTAQLLLEARYEFYRLGLDRESIYDTGDRGRLVSTWAGTIKTSTLSLKLKIMGIKTVDQDGFLEVEDLVSGQSVEAPVQVIVKQAADDIEDQSLSGLENVMSEKFHRYLSADLLLEDAASSLVDLRALPQLASGIVGQNARDGSF
jgi:ATP-dependent Lhr-like helicase